MSKIIRHGLCFSNRRSASLPSVADKVEKPSFRNELVINEQIIASSSTIKMGLDKPLFTMITVPLVQFDAKL
jgi:hypothetical protein